MSYKTNIDAEVRGFSFASSGDDEFDGATLERPKRTVQAAIDAAAAIQPPPVLALKGSVRAVQGGTFNEGFVISEFINFSAPESSFFADQPVGLTMGDGLVCTLFGFGNDSDNSTVFLFEDISLSVLRAVFASVRGEDSIGLEVKGTNLGNFAKIDSLPVRGVRSIGIKITGDLISPFDVNVDTCTLFADGGVFVDYGPNNDDDATIINISTVVSQGSTIFTPDTINTTGYIVRSGHLSVVSQGLLIASTIIHVKGGTLDIDIASASGDIIVDAGGELNINILHHTTGTITNNGVINGIIDGIAFGNAAHFTIDNILVGDDSGVVTGGGNVLTTG